MIKYVCSGLVLTVLTGCSAYKKELISRDMDHEIYIAIENARINDEPACILGGKIKNAFSKYNTAISTIK